VRSEGLTEKVGNLVFQCSNYPASAVVSGNISLFFPVSVTNQIGPNNNNAVDAVLSINSGSGFIPTSVPGTISGNEITFQGVSVTVPANGAFNLQISNVRVAAYQFGLSGPQSIDVSISSPFPIGQSQIAVAYAQEGLYATLYSTGITCVGSPLPTTVTVSNLFAANTAFASTRVTEGFAGAFQPRGAGDMNGTRFIVRYSGFPANASVYVPDFVAGSDAAVPTAGGDLGGTQSPGQYVPGSGTLLLARVQYTDATGAGGYVAATPANGVLNTTNPVALTGGAGFVVYEVVDTNPSQVEDAQFPTFIALPSVSAPATAQETISFAPVSTLATPSPTAAVPRFEPTTPASDCSIVGDCQAGYFPKLTASASSLNLTAVAGASSTRNVYIAVDNSAGGIMQWSASASYNQASVNWLTLSPASGQNDGTIILSANAQGLTAGTYTANVTVTAGPLAGSASFQVTLTVTAAATTGTTGTTGSTGGTGGTGGTGATAPTPAITVSSVVSAASFASGPLVGGSLSTVLGSNLAGTNVAVTFDGNPATLLYTGASQINLQVPAAIAAQASSTMVVTVNGASSAPQILPVSPAWPAIFSGGVLNQDNTVNGPGVGANPGSILQIFVTGLPANVPVTAIVGSQTNLTPVYAGPAPGIAGVQQVNLMVPPGTGGGGSTQVAVCATAGGRQFCSTGLPLYVN
jgi:uncharacterized protein (TIGR03437 family)